MDRQNNNSGNSSNQDTYVLFFHEQSAACQKLKGKIPSDKNIQIVDVSKVQTLPQQITAIPALVINNKDILIGKQVFDYFNKSDEMEFINFGSKGSSFISNYSNLDENDNSMNGSFGSLIDAPDMSSGIPEWNEDNDPGKTLDMDKLMLEREKL